MACAPKRKTERSLCLPRCLDWRVPLFMTPKLRATAQIMDTVRQMSAQVLCSRHVCCWHGLQKSGEGNMGEHGGDG